MKETIAALSSSAAHLSAVLEEGVIHIRGIGGLQYPTARLYYERSKDELLKNHQLPGDFS